MKLRLIAPVMAALALTACASDERPASTSQATMSSGAGQVGGSLVGGAAAQSFSDADQAFMTQKINRALESAPTTQPVTWTNPDDGAQVQLVATRTFQRPDSTYCRNYTQSVTIKGKTESTRGTACRQSDGSWQAAAG